MKIRAFMLLGAALLWGAGTVLAETSAVSPSGFLVTHRHEVHATPQQVYEAIGRIGRWWSDVHTYSGHAANMSLNLTAGGCFCEGWDENSVQHAQVHVCPPRNAGAPAGRSGPAATLGR